MSNDYSNKLIFGKDQTTRIVSVEVEGENLHIFRELEDGSIDEQILPATYWFLTNRSISPTKEYKLEGNQYFRYYHEFSDPELMKQVSNKLYQKRIDKYHIYDNKEANLVINGITYFKGLKPKEVSVLSFDIESSGIKQLKDSEIYLITNTFRNIHGTINKTFSLENYNNCGEMIDDWCTWVREINPSLLIGHNILMYDLPFLNHVAKLNGTTLKLGRDLSDIHFNERTSKFRKDGSQDYEFHNAHVYGREIIDTLFTAIKFDIQREFESYGLKPIIKHLGLEKEGRTFVDASKMRKFFNERHTNPENWELAKKYAEEDSDDALKVLDKMFPATFYFTQSIPKSVQQINNSATGAQINSFLVRAYIQDGHSIPQATELTERVEGGISFAIPGIYRNLIKIDLKSCYPSQILRFKLYDEKKDPKGYFYEMVRHFTYERFDLKDKYKETKDIYYYEREQTSKIFINSAYGVTNTAGLNFNCPHIAAKITFESRNVIDMALRWASGEGKEYWFDVFNKAVGKEEDDETIEE